VKLIRELRAENARLRALLADSMVKKVPKRLLSLLTTGYVMFTVFFFFYLYLLSLDTFHVIYQGSNPRHSGTVFYLYSTFSG